MTIRDVGYVDGHFNREKVVRAKPPDFVSTEKDEVVVTFFKRGILHIRTVEDFVVHTCHSIRGFKEILVFSVTVQPLED